MMSYATFTKDGNGAINGAHIKKQVVLINGLPFEIKSIYGMVQEEDCVEELQVESQLCSLIQLLSFRWIADPLHKRDANCSQNEVKGRDEVLERVEPDEDFKHLVLEVPADEFVWMAVLVVEGVLNVLLNLCSAEAFEGSA